MVSVGVLDLGDPGYSLLNKLEYGIEDSRQYGRSMQSNSHPSEGLCGGARTLICPNRPEFIWDHKFERILGADVYPVVLKE